VVPPLVNPQRGAAQTWEADALPTELLPLGEGAMVSNCPSGEEFAD